MGDNWEKVRLGDLLNFRRGHDLSKNKMIDGEFAVIGSNGIIGYHNEYTTKAPSISIGRSGNVGNPYFINENTWSHNTCLYIDDFKGNDEKYIYYLLCSLDLKRYGGGSAVPTLNRNHIHPLIVNATLNIKKQEKIANILSSLDDKIENNKRTSKKLEEIAQTLFNRWFVEFNFPDEDSKPYKDNGGEMVESELGLIPKGWEVMNLESTSKLNAGGDKPKVYSKYETMECKIPIYSNGITDDGLYGYTDIAKVNTESVTVSARGTIGFLCLREEPFVPIVRLITVIPKIKNVSAKYLFFYLKNINIMGTGTTQQQLTVPAFRNTKIIVPKLEILEQFQTVVDYLYIQRKICNNTNKELLEIRDTLLPKLMSGEMEI